MSKQNLSLNLLMLILLMIFLVLPFSILSNFLKYQSDIFFNILQTGSTNLLNTNILIFLIILLIVGILSLYILLKLKKKISYYLIYPLLFICIWIFLSSFFLPLSSLTGIIDPASAGVNKKNLLLVIIFSTILSFLLVYKKKINFFIYFGYFFLFINFVNLSFNIFFEKKSFKLGNNESKVEETKNLLLESAMLNPKNNILVISLDGISSLVLDDIFQLNKEYNIVFKDFEFFDNIISQAPATTLSIAGELYGNLDFKKISLDENLLVEKLKRKINLFDDLKDYYTFGDYNTFNKNKDKIIKNYINDLEVNDTLKSIKLNEVALEIYRYSISRYGTRVLVNYFDDLKFYFYKRYYQINFDQLNLNEKVFFHRGASFEKKTLSDIQILKDFIAKLSFDDSYKNEVSLRMFHFNFTHFPVDFDKECNYLSFDKKRFNSIQNYDGLKEETLCSLKLMKKLLLKLKEKNLYDNSTIIFKSDHGVPSNYFINSKYENINYLISNHKQFGYLRYKPFLMIKERNRSQNKLKINNEFKSLNFLNNYYCELLNQDMCKPLKDVQLFIPQKKNSSFFINDLEKIRVNSKEELLERILRSK